MKQKIIFLGDSITDCQRKRDIPSNIGVGYVSIIQAALCQRFGDTYTCINRGVSGDRAKDLRQHWQERCIDNQADIFSLYIGVNDTWRRYDANDLTPTEAFEADTRQLLDLTFEGTPAKPASSILIQPFVLDVPIGTKSHWREEDLDAKASVIRTLANEYGTRFLPLQEILDEAITHLDAEFWAADGVHPTPAGHYLIASEWLKLMEPLLK
ncbi:SGNH/GDSL hydrolase family protein [Kiritimatiellota bacterium B12222]|nr:SGNH/GDSL hydrolase family protein [Kiritimatiellota bacterium B12222]